MPLTINCAYTEQINPAGAAPVLSRDQIWRGLQRKIRKAQDFVPVITGCDVIEEKENEVTRIATFKAAPGQQPQKVKEVCKSFYPTKVDFWQESGALITNTVSDGPGFTEHDYNMTYTFEFRHDDVEENSEQHKQRFEEHLKMAKMAVNMSIESMRRMAAAGELDG